MVNKRPNTMSSPQEVKEIVRVSSAILKHKGFRVTKQRTSVIEVLANETRPLSTTEIHHAVNAVGGKIDIVSCYRVIEALLESGLCHQIGVDGGYVLCTVDEHCHPNVLHTVCSQCKETTEFEMNDAFVNSPGFKSSLAGFEPTNVHIEVVGLCKSCQASA